MSNYSAIANSHFTVHYSTHLSLLSLLCLQTSLLVTASNGGRSPSSGFVPVPQLPASRSNSSQGPNLSSSLTHSLTHLPTHFIPLTRRLAPISRKTPALLTAVWRFSSNQRQSHIATDGQSISDQIFFTVWQLQSCFCGAPSLTRGRVCLLYMLLALASAVFLGSEPLGTRDHILLSQFRDYLIVASYDSQGHGGGIRPRLHTGVSYNGSWPSLYSHGTDLTENIASDSSSIVAWESVATIT
jgi:hypothetical protein